MNHGFQDGTDRGGWYLHCRQPAVTMNGGGAYTTRVERIGSWSWSCFRPDETWTYYDHWGQDGFSYGHLKQATAADGRWELYTYDSNGVCTVVNMGMGNGGGHGFEFTYGVTNPALTRVEKRNGYEVGRTLLYYFDNEVQEWFCKDNCVNVFFFWFLGFCSCDF